MATVDVLIPTINRLSALVMTLSGLAGQSLADLRVIIADQSDQPADAVPVARALGRIIEARGGAIVWHSRRPCQGIAEQRDFLLRQAAADHVLFVDDDIWMEPWVIEQLHQTLQTERCGFVGAFPAGLSFRTDVRPHQQAIEYWTGRVQPEVIWPDSPEWQRARLHAAANLYHVSQTLPDRKIRRYKVAWVGACTLYDRQKLLQVGGFSFWSRLPRYHSGEEVLVQNLLMRRWGGCAIIPSGTYHAEVESTVLNSAGTVDGHALELLPEMVERYAPETSREAAGVSLC